MTEVTCFGFVFESLLKGICDYVNACIEIFKPRAPSIMRKTRVEDALFGQDYERLYFEVVEKRINEQDEQIFKSGKDHYVYD